MNQRIFDSPVGRLLLGTRDGKLCKIRRVVSDDTCVENVADPVLDEAQKQLDEYFCGRRTAFTLPLEIEGTAFECAVWQQLLQIPFGTVMTYGQLAAKLGMPKAARAVGGACSSNPLLIVVPCHRVIAGTGKLTGFAAGMQAKRVLLETEGWTIQGDRVIKE